MKKTFIPSIIKNRRSFFNLPLSIGLVELGAQVDIGLAHVLVLLLQCHYSNRQNKTKKCDVMRFDCKYLYI